MVFSAANKLRVFRLQLSDAGRSFYSSGDKVSGCVTLQAEQACRLAALRLTAAGCARVDHRSGKNRRNRNQELEYLKYDEEIRLEEHLTQDADGCFLLPPGQIVSFQFGFELPASGQLVSSYKGKFGHVRYYVRAVLERPSQHALQCEQEFEVEEPLDINRPELLAPVAAAVQKKLTCLFIPDGQVTISARLDRKGYCEGEDISINAKFENTCSRIVVPKAAIVARHTYVADGHEKVLCQKLTAVRGSHIISGMCDMWQGKSIRVPKLRPSLLGCDIIKVDYALRIYLHIPGSQKLALELPLVIGTVPFDGVGSRTASVCSQNCSLSSWSSFPSAPPSYSDISRDLGLDGPRTPLLGDYDGGDQEDQDQDQDEDEGGLFMRAPEVYGRPAQPPPPYSQLDKEAEDPRRGGGA